MIGAREWRRMEIAHLARSSKSPRRNPWIASRSLRDAVSIQLRNSSGSSPNDDTPSRSKLAL
jgi:hypothetical protein